MIPLVKRRLSSDATYKPLLSLVWVFFTVSQYVVCFFLFFTLERMQRHKPAALTAGDLNRASLRTFPPASTEPRDEVPPGAAPRPN